MHYLLTQKIQALRGRRALQLSLTALQRMRDGFRHNMSDANDPVRAAVHAIDQCFPEEVKNRLLDPDSFANAFAS